MSEEDGGNAFPMGVAVGPAGDVYDPATAGGAWEQEVGDVEDDNE